MNSDILTVCLRPKTRPLNGRRQRESHFYDKHLPDQLIYNATIPTCNNKGFSNVLINTCLGDFFRIFSGNVYDVKHKILYFYLDMFI